MCHVNDVNGQTLGDSFGISYSAGKFSWMQAKAIGVAYNLIVGRGVQTLLILISYRVFLGALLRNAETAAIPYETYTTMAFQHGSTKSVWCLLKGAFSLGGLRRKLTMLCLVCSTCWILIVPTYLDLMTGYVPKKEAMLRLSSGFLESWSNATYAVDGQEYHVSNQGFYSSVTNLNGTFHLGNESWAANELFSLDADCLEDQPHCSFQFGKARDDAFTCVTAPHTTYEWGFSVVIFALWIPLQAIWCLGMYLVWFDVHVNSSLWRRGRHLGTWRMILDLAGAVSEDLGQELSTLSESELEKEIGKLGPVGYSSPIPGQSGIADHVALSSRVGSKV